MNALKVLHWWHKYMNREAYEARESSRAVPGQGMFPLNAV